MKYTIVDANLAEKKGFNKQLHRMLSASKMILNENELRLIDEDIESVASTLGGRVMSHAEITSEMNKMKLI